jgi:hypothetical protein
MKTSDKLRFVKLWEREHTATAEAHKLSGRIDFLNKIEAPSRSLEVKEKAQLRKAEKAYDKIYEGTKAGTFPANAVALCVVELGYLAGYVADCYAECVQDVTDEGYS